MRVYVLHAIDLPQPANKRMERKGKRCPRSLATEHTQQPAAIITLLLKIIFPCMHATPTD